MLSASMPTSARLGAALLASLVGAAPAAATSRDGVQARSTSPIKTSQIGGPLHDGGTYFHVVDCPIADFSANAATYSVDAIAYANGKSVNLQTLFPANSGWVASPERGLTTTAKLIGEGYLKSVLTPFALRH